MNYKKIFLFLLLFSCTPIQIEKDIKYTQTFSNAGFTLIYDNKYFNNKLVSKKIDDRSLIVFQKKLKSKTPVKVTNMINGKSIIASVGGKAKFPNSVISKRIAKELELNPDEPYITIKEIDKNSTFVANKTKTYDEERKVAEKAPVDEIGIKDLSKSNDKNSKKKNEINFNYIIKIADFYYLESAKMLINRIKNEININNAKINELSKTKFRVYLGPYNDFQSIKKDYEKILKLMFENIEIIKL